MPNREQGRCKISVTPLYDENQRRFESNKSAEKKALKAIQQIANGEVEDWIIDAIKSNMCREFDRVMESNENKGLILLQAFINEEDLGQVLNYKDEIMAINIDDIKRVAKQYLNNDYLALYIEKGNLSKDAKIKETGIQTNRTSCWKTISLCTAIQEFTDRTGGRKVYGFQ